MLFETIRCEKGIVLNLSYHQERLDHSLSILGAERSFDLASLLSPSSDGVFRCRFVYDRFDYSLEYIPYLAKPITSLKLLRADHIEYPLKYADRDHLNALYAQRGTCDDVVILKEGLLTDTTIANIALYIDGQWITPQSPLLHGTTRARLLNEGFLSTAPLKQNDIAKARKVAVFNAMIGFVEVDNGIII